MADKEYGVSFPDDENVFKLVVEIVAQLRTYTKNTEWYSLNR